MAREQVALVRAPEVNGGRLVAGSRVVVFDATVTETSADVATPTRFPIETGADITDHVRIEPVTLEMDVVVTDTQLRVGNGADAIRDRSSDQYRLLVEIEAARETFDVVRTYRTYSNMLLVGVRLRRDTRSGRANLRFSLSFEEIRTVAFQKTFIPTEEIESPAEQRAEAPVDRDRQRMSDASGEEITQFNQLVNGLEAADGTGPAGLEAAGARGQSILSLGLN